MEEISDDRSRRSMPPTLQSLARRHQLVKLLGGAVIAISMLAATQSSLLAQNDWQYPDPFFGGNCRLTSRKRRLPRKCFARDDPAGGGPIAAGNAVSGRQVLLDDQANRSTTATDFRPAARGGGNPSA